MTFGVTDTGFAVKDFSSIVKSAESEIRKNLGANIDLSDYSIVKQILNSYAYSLAELWQVTESVHYAGFVSTATGSNLDACVALLGIARLEATQATGPVIFSRSSAASYDITIPAGTVVATTTGVEFATTAAVTLAAGQTSISAVIQAVDTGADGNVDTYKITVIPVTISGIETVTNTVATTGGSDAETDTALRTRALQYSPGAKATLAAIQSAIAAVTGVTAALVTEDTEAHTITATVRGGTDLLVNAAITATRPAGIACTLVRPTAESVVVTATVAKASSADSAAVLSNVQAAITAYFGGLTIGDDVLYSTVAAAIIGADGVASLNSLSITCDSTTISAFGSSIAISGSQIAVEGTPVITVS